MTPDNIPRPRNRRTHHHVGMELRCVEQRVRCLKLRLEGQTVREVAHAVGVSPSTVNGYIQSALRAGRAATVHLGAQIREQTHTKFQAIIDQWLPVATGSGHPEEAARAAKRVLRARADLLAFYGHAIPKQVPPPAEGSKQELVVAPPPSQPVPRDPDPQGDLLYAAFQDIVLLMARDKLLPTTSYDDAWDGLEKWQPGKYEPKSREVEDFIRAAWSSYLAFVMD